MRAAAYEGDRAIGIRDVVERPPGPGQVRIRVGYVGLCGTDLHIVHGNMDARVARPLVFGHEMSGVVEAVGPGVQTPEVGTPVTVMPLDWDGTCPACLAGHQHICQHLDFIGIDSEGALQELWNVPARAVLPLPATVSLRDAALVEPVAVAVHDVRRADLVAGDRAVVFGGGPIGVLIASVARHAGADVVVVEPDVGRAAAVAALGFAVLDPRVDDLVAEVDAWTGDAGADVVFEVSGAAAAVEACTGLAKVRGTVVVVAIHPTPRPVDLQRVFWRELRILGARVYERRDFERAIELVGEGAIPADSIITSVRPLEEISAAVHDLEQGQAMKVLIDVRAGAR